MKKTTYKRKDLTNKISYKLNMNCDESKIILDCVLDSFNELFLSKKEDMRIELRNFGVFNVYTTKKRFNARNPKTRENVIIPPRKKVVFKASKSLKNQLNNK